MTGFQVNVGISQHGADRCRLRGLISIEELAVFDALMQYATWHGCNRINHEGHRFYEFTWPIVPQRLPYLKVQSRARINKYFKTLCDCGLLAPHPGKAYKSFYRFGDNYSQFIGAIRPS